MAVEAQVAVSRIYIKGNLHGERGKRILIPVDPGVPYTTVKDGERTPMEYNPQTKISTVIRIPQF